ncbi:MAG: hypothetical protein AB1705_25175 [Verrucomicrobiota bacterium]
MMGQGTTERRGLENSWRASLGGIALGLGCIGLLIFILAMPVTLFGARFWSGFGFREGPLPTTEQIEAAQARQFWWSVKHRLTPLFVVSIAFVGYGLYEARREIVNRTTAGVHIPPLPGSRQSGKQTVLP